MTPKETEDPAFGNPSTKRLLAPKSALSRLPTARVAFAPAPVQGGLSACQPDSSLSTTSTVADRNSWPSTLIAISYAPSGQVSPAGRPR